MTAAEVMRHVPPESPVFTESLNIISRQSRQLSRLIDDLLDVSRAATNKMELSKSRINVSEALRIALETSHPYIDLRNHRFKAMLPDEEIYIDADNARLVQAVANLLNNAARYTPTGGDITLSLNRTQAEVVIAVKDTGIGIRPEMIAKIFDMFTQGGKEQNGGLGIGLTLVKRIVELHGGTIEAKSEGESLGSEFVIRLPAQ
jgi:signal transduction histidine kinase